VKRVAPNNGRVTDGRGLRVLILEDDDFTRMTLAAVVSSLGHEVVGQAGTIVQAIDCARSASPDVAIVDLDLGVGPTGIDAAHGLRGVLPEIGIVVLSSYADPRVMGKRSRPMPAGARYLSKQDLGDASILDDALRASLVMEESSVTLLRHLDLSESQLEIMRLVASGLSNDEIARRLWLTEAGVRRAITRLLRKLGLESTKEVNARVLLTRAYAQLAGRAVSDG
jgi:two-component system, NarL family, nitrate/nitrite response regulator NarL